MRSLRQLFVGARPRVPPRWLAATHPYYLLDPTASGAENSEVSSVELFVAVAVMASPLRTFSSSGLKVKETLPLASVVTLFSPMKVSPSSVPVTEDPRKSRSARACLMGGSGFRDPYRAQPPGQRSGPRLVPCLAPETILGREDPTDLRSYYPDARRRRAKRLASAASTPCRGRRIAPVRSRTPLAGSGSHARLPATCRRPLRRRPPVPGR